MSKIADSLANICENIVKEVDKIVIEFMQKKGISYDDLEEKGIIIPVLELHDNYIKSLTFGDEIEIQISLSKLSAVRFRMKYEIIKVSTGEVVHRAETAHCFVAPGLVPLNLKKKFPEVYQVFENYLEPEDN